jgi:hypothetical protein
LSLTINGFRIDITTALQQPELHLPHPTSNVSKPLNFFIASMLAWSSNMGVRYCFPSQCSRSVSFVDERSLSLRFQFSQNIQHRIAPCAA